MAVTPERRAEIRALVSRAIGRPLPRPRLVCVGGVRREEPPLPNSGVVTFDAPEIWRRIRDREEVERRRKDLDPFRMGHWGNSDD
jgi:hypothetical protein